MYWKSIMAAEADISLLCLVQGGGTSEVIKSFGVILIQDVHG